MLPQNAALCVYFLKKDITESETVLFSLCLEIPTITQIADSRKN
jgi:hypothetical protein